MAKVIDITEKLSFEENPKLVIRGKELEVNADAATVLQIMGMLGEDTETTPKQVMDMYNLIFPRASREAIEALKLGFADFQVVVESALNLITGTDGDAAGEAQTHTTILSATMI